MCRGTPHKANYGILDPKFSKKSKCLELVTELQFTPIEWPLIGPAFSSICCSVRQFTGRGSPGFQGLGKIGRDRGVGRGRGVGGGTSGETVIVPVIP